MSLAAFLRQRIRSAVVLHAIGWSGRAGFRDRRFPYRLPGEWHIEGRFFEPLQIRAWHDRDELGATRPPAQDGLALSRLAPLAGFV
jgi:hypothetical protein